MLAAYRSVTPAQVKASTKEAAAKIYWRTYWVQSGGDLLLVGIDFMVFVCDVSIGSAQAVKSLQRVIGVTAGGDCRRSDYCCCSAYKGDLITAYAAECL